MSNKNKSKIKIPKEIVSQSLVDFGLSLGLGGVAGGAIYMANELHEQGHSALATGGYLVGAGAAATSVTLAVSGARRLIQARKVMKTMGEIGESFTAGFLEGIGDCFADFSNEISEQDVTSDNVVPISVGSEDGGN